MTASIAKAKVDQYMKTKEAERVAEQEKIRVSISGYLANVYDAIASGLAYCYLNKLVIK